MMMTLNAVEIGFFSITTCVSDNQSLLATWYADFCATLRAYLDSLEIGVLSSGTVSGSKRYPLAFGFLSIHLDQKTSVCLGPRWPIQIFPNGKVPQEVLIGTKNSFSF